VRLRARYVASVELIVLEFLETEPNWLVVSVVGAMLGALFAKFGSLLTYPFRSAMPAAGTWFSYHYTFQDGQPTLHEDTIVIRKAPLGGSRVKITPSFAEGQHISKDAYRGVVICEGTHLLLHARAVLSGNPTTLSIRLASRIPPNDRMMIGLWLSYDHDGRPASGVVAMNREAMSPNEASEVLYRWFDAQRGVIRVPQHPRRRRSTN
jgi:hypothetical protein